VNSMRGNRRAVLDCEKKKKNVGKRKVGVKLFPTCPEKTKNQHFFLPSSGGGKTLRKGKKKELDTRSPMNSSKKKKEGEEPSLPHRDKRKREVNAGRGIGGGVKLRLLLLVRLGRGKERRGFLRETLKKRRKNKNWIYVFAKKKREESRALCSEASSEEEKEMTPRKKEGENPHPTWGNQVDGVSEGRKRRSIPLPSRGRRGKKNQLKEREPAQWVLIPALRAERTINGYFLPCLKSKGGKGKGGGGREKKKGAGRSCLPRVARSTERKSEKVTAQRSFYSTSKERKKKEKEGYDQLFLVAGKKKRGDISSPLNTEKKEVGNQRNLLLRVFRAIEKKGGS